MKKISVVILAFTTLLSAVLLSLSSNTVAATTETNLVENGDFQLPLEGSWKIVKVRELGEFPRIGRSDEHTLRNFYLYMDTPRNTMGYVESQQFFLPKTDKALLNFKVWNGEAPVSANVTLVDTSGNESVVARFPSFSIHRIADPSEVPSTHSVDITRFGGQNIRLRIWSTSDWNSGSVVFFDDIQIEAVRDRKSVITLEAISLGRPCSPGLRFPAPQGASIAIVGNLFPAPSSPAPVKIQAIRPDGRIPSLKVATDSTGYYEHIFAPDIPGVWGISASWPGDNEHDADESYTVYFPVSANPRLDLISGTLNGRILDPSDPEIEVKPNEPILGQITISSVERCRNTNLPIVAFNTWEKNSWNLLVYAGGSLAGDPMGTKTYFPAPAFDLNFAALNYKLGAFSINYTWTVAPLNSSIPNDVTRTSSYSNPTYQAPSREGVYYVGLMQGLQNLARNLLYEVAPLGTLFGSAWDVDAQTWEAFIPNRRDENTRFTTLTIRVRVVNVDSWIDEAKKILQIAEKNDWEVGEAPTYYQEALREYQSGRYSAAKFQAEKAYATAQPIVETQISEVRKVVIETREKVKKHETEIDVTRILPYLKIMDEQFNTANYRKAKLVAEDILKSVNNELLLRSQAQRKKELLSALLWEAQVTSRDRAEIERSFKTFLDLFANNAYGASLERAGFIESKIVSDRVVYLFFLGISFLLGGVPSFAIGNKLENMTTVFVGKYFKRHLPRFLRNYSALIALASAISLVLLVDSLFGFTRYSIIGVALLFVSVGLGWLLVGKRRNLLRAQNRSLSNELSR